MYSGFCMSIGEKQAGAGKAARIYTVLFAAAGVFGQADEVNRAKELVVMIGGGTKGAGIVFHVDAQRRAWIMTADHVVRPGGTETKGLTVRFFGWPDDVPATLRPEKSEENDLAVVVAAAPEGVTFPWDRLAPAFAYEQGLPVLAVGWPDDRRWGATTSGSPLVDVGASRIRVDEPRIKKGYSGGALITAGGPFARGSKLVGAGSLVGMVLNTDGVTAEALRMDRAIELLRRDLKLTVSLGAPGVSAPAVSGVKPGAPAGPTRPAPGAAWTNPKDGLVYRWIPSGEFRMGCNASSCGDDEKPVHRLLMYRGFWMGETEVTQSAYTRVTGKSNPSKYQGATRPVETVSWDDAKAYCRLANMQLPTEAEWEYAARAGVDGQTIGKLEEIAWVGKGAAEGTNEAGRLKPNAWGLRDMLGNVWEWVADWYDPAYYAHSSVVSPTGPTSGTVRAMRGGSWNYSFAQRTSFSMRSGVAPTSRSAGVGFRCAGDRPPDSE
jgi:formylglycine-generating enzyme required for sulfatase activity